MANGTGTVNSSLRNTLVVAVATLLVSACATTAPKQRPQAHIQVQEQVGFTIIEEGKVDNAVRAEYNSSLLLLQQGSLDQGATLLEDVAAATPELSAPRIDLGIAYHRAGNLEAAETNLLLALEANPNQPAALNELGIVYRKMGRFQDARASYEAALEVFPGYHYARRNLAVLCDLYLADLQCALDNYEAYMATVRDDQEAEMWITDIRRRLGQ